MRLGIMQPYFLPYAGHFSLIANTDLWIVFDTCQYTPKRWMNRNRVLRADGGWSWLNVPVQHESRMTPVRHIRRADPAGDLRRVRGHLQHYRRFAPHAATVLELVDAIFEDTGGDFLVDLNVRALAAVCEYLEIPFRFHRLSDLELDLGAVEHPGGWAPAISAAVGAAEYLNPVGGSTLFDVEEFAAIGTRLYFCDAPLLRYRTGPYEFVPQLSIIDPLMWCEPEEVRDAVAAARILPGEDVLDASHAGSSTSLVTACA